MSAEPDHSPSTFSPFRSKTFLSMWTASLVSNFGTLIQSVGAAWLMTSLSGSADMVALVEVATVLPLVVFSLPAGAAADIWDRRRVMLTAQGAMLLVSTVLALATWAGILGPWALLAATFALGMGAALFGPAWQASVRELVPPSDLPPAIALNSVAFNLARASGPALGGILVAWAGAQLAFAVNAVSYLGLIAVLTLWRRPKVERGLPPEPMMQAILAGLRFARLSHSLQSVLVRSATFGFFAGALWALVPLIARDILRGGAFTYGLLLAALGGGAVLGALAGTRVRERLTNERIVALGSAIFAAATLAAALSPSLFVTLAVLLAGGASWLLVLSTFNITIQLRSPQWVVGRAMATYQIGLFGGLSLGAWLWGVAAGYYGVPASLLAAGLMLSASALLGRLLPMPSTERVDLDPAPDDPARASGRPALDRDSGPVVTSIEYGIEHHNLAAFLATARRMRRMRGRNGARRWALLQDTSDPLRWTERFETPTWLDYLRIRDRTTVTDREIEKELWALHQGDPPAVRHFLAHEPSGASAAASFDPHDGHSVYDPSLPPGLKVAR